MIAQSNEIPFARIVFFFIGGVLLAEFIPIISALLSLILAFLCFFSIFFLKNKLHKSQEYAFSGILLSVTIFFLGLFLHKINNQSNRNIPINKQTVFIARIVKAPCEKEKTIKVVSEIQAISMDSVWKDEKYLINIFLEKDSFAKTVQFGDEFIAFTKISPIENAGNPYEFDNKTYQNRQGIFYQSYITSGKWKRINTNTCNFLATKANQIRNYLLDVYRKYGLKNQEFAVASALTIGYTDEIDAETRRIYSTTGAMHILSISGLHLGILFALINYLLFFLRRNKFQKILKALIIITFLWLFALVSGLSASVMRSAFMFSLLVISQLVINYQNHNIFNSLAVSAFFLLLLDTNNLFNIGFQLSYIAILSIALFQSEIESLLHFENRVGRWIWKLCAVSIAAQLGTFPLSLYYFNQFPNYFLLTNLLAIPLSSLILYTGVVLFACSKFVLLSQGIAFVFKYLVSALNKFLSFTDSLPFSYSCGIHINGLQVILLYVALLLFFYFIKHRNVVVMKSAVCLLIVFLAISIVNKAFTLEKSRITIFSVRGKMLNCFSTNGKCIVLGDSSLLNNTEKLNFYISKYLTNTYSSSKPEVIPIKPSHFAKNKLSDYFLLTSNYINFCGKRIVFLSNKEKIKKYSDRKIAIDYLILSQNIPIEIEDILKQYDFDKIIIDSSNAFSRREKWIRDCKHANKQCFATELSGAFDVFF